MPVRTLTYFVADVHLGLQAGDPREREGRFVRFLRGLDVRRTDALYLLGDIWDFWFEYRDLIPKDSLRALSALQTLVDAGVKVFFFGGNHDCWTGDAFPALGIHVLEQPTVVSLGGRRFCLGHGDGLGPGMWSYKQMRALFHSRWLRRLFSALHPWVAYRLGRGWSRHSRQERKVAPYHFQGEQEPLYRWCAALLERQPIDFFVFGHYHCAVDLPLPQGSRLLLLGSWVDHPDALVFDAALGELRRITA